MSDIQWMSYAELASALGITLDSGKNLVRRKRWQRQSGNDGLARIGVPVEYIMKATPQAIDTPTITPIDPPANPPIEPPTDGAMVAAIEVLREHITRLETELATAKNERDQERLRGAQVEVLTAVLEIEKQRTEELRQERDRWAKLAEESQRTAADLAKPRGIWGWLRAGA